MERLISCFGLFVMIGLAWLMSSHKRQVSGRMVVGGLLLQISLALLILKTPPGEIAFRAAGDFFTQVLSYVDHGSRFMFGMSQPIEMPLTVHHPRYDFAGRVPAGEVKSRLEVVSARLAGETLGEITVVIGTRSRVFSLDQSEWHIELVDWGAVTAAELEQEVLSSGVYQTVQPLSAFAFGVLPTIIFFSSLMAVMYHVGIMQRVVECFAWIMQRTLGTSGAESLSAAANIFVGQTEAPLVIRPYIGSMTQSEIMAVMVGGFATIAGGVLAAFVSMHIDAGHLITASVISAPAALLIAKVMVPETEVSPTLGTVKVTVERRSANLIEAAASGATDGLKLALNIAAMLIAFLALVAMADAIVGWTGSWFGQSWSLAVLLGYLFSPFAWLMGIERADCLRAGELLGLKMATNEFVAYQRLAVWVLPESGVELSQRSQHILTYALCGFANFSSIGIQIGGIGGIAPERRADLARLGLRAMLGGTLAAFMTACIAGVLI